MPTPDAPAGWAYLFESHLSTVWQDTAQTTAATLDGDPVAAAVNIGSSLALEQSDNAKRMVLKLNQANGQPTLRCDNPAKHLVKAFTLNAPFTLAICYRLNSATTSVSDFILNGYNNAAAMYTSGTGNVVENIGLSANAGIVLRRSWTVNDGSFGTVIIEFHTTGKMRHQGYEVERGPLGLGTAAGGLRLTNQGSQERGANIDIAAVGAWPGQLITDSPTGVANLEERWETLFGATRSLSTVTAATENNIVFVGDSLLAGYGLPYTQSAPYQFISNRGLPWIGRNLSQPGYRADEIAGIPTTAAVALYKSSAARNIVAVLSGTNSILQNGTTGDTAADIYADIKSTWDACIAAGFRVIACTIPALKDWNGVAPANAETMRGAVNTLIRAGSAYYTQLADLAADSRIGGPASTNLTYFQSDYIHFANGGNAVVAELIGEEVAPYPGLEWTAQGERLQYTARAERLQYTAQGERLQYTAIGEY